MKRQGFWLLTMLIWMISAAGCAHAPTVSAPVVFQPAETASPEPAESIGIAETPVLTQTPEPTQAPERTKAPSTAQTSTPAQEKTPTAPLAATPTPAPANTAAVTEAPAPSPSAAAEKSGEPDGILLALSLGKTYEVTPYGAGAAGVAELTLSEETGADGALCLYLQFEDQRTTLKNGYTRFVAAWVYIPEDGAILLVTTDTGSDDDVTDSFLLRSGAPTPADTLEAEVEKIGSNGFLTTGRWLNVLGTWWGRCEYTLEPDGTFRRYSGSYLIDGTDRPLTARAQIPAELHENGGWEAAVLESGASVTVVGTDNENYAFFTLPDGAFGRIRFERREDGLYIAGEPDGAFFDALPYAG